MSLSKGKERRIHCYKSSQKILLVGEGDFSFSACLARAFRTATNIVATSYLEYNWLVHKHWTSIPHLEKLERSGCMLLYEVDVYNMHTHPILKKMKFDIIIFNFPHAGHYDYLCERDMELIKMHRELVEAYFRSASKMLREGGEVHIRHRDDHPYDTWNVVLLAAKAGLKLKEKVGFQKSDYPGYHNKRGGDDKTNQTFPILCAFTFKFVLDLPKVCDRHPKNFEVLDDDNDNDLPKNHLVGNDLIMKDGLQGDLAKKDGVNADIVVPDDHLKKDGVDGIVVTNDLLKKDGVDYYDDDPRKINGVNDGHLVVDPLEINGINEGLYGIVVDPLKIDRVDHGLVVAFIFAIYCLILMWSVYSKSVMN